MADLEWVTVGPRKGAKGKAPSRQQAEAIAKRPFTQNVPSPPLEPEQAKAQEDVPIEKLKNLSVSNTAARVQPSAKRTPRLLREKLLNNGKLLWVDCEMTGLDLKKDKLIEVAVLVTDEQLKVLDEGIELVIRADKELLDSMDEWCTKTHRESGLTQRCLDSELSMAEAEDRIVDYTARHFPDGMALLAGASVHVDKAFIAKDMPRWHHQLTYRVLDVSTLRELIARWFPRATERPDRSSTIAHRAKADIVSSIEDLKYFRKIAFKSAGS